MIPGIPSMVGAQSVGCSREIGPEYGARGTHSLSYWSFWCVECCFFVWLLPFHPLSIPVLPLAPLPHIQNHKKFIHVGEQSLGGDRSQLLVVLYSNSPYCRAHYFWIFLYLKLGFWEKHWNYIKTNHYWIVFFWKSNTSFVCKVGNFKRWYDISGKGTKLQVRRFGAVPTSTT